MVTLEKIYRVKLDDGRTCDVDPNIMVLVQELYQSSTPLKVPAIRFVRAHMGLGLKDAKDLCDALGKIPRYGF